MSSESPPNEGEKVKGGGKKRIRNFTADERAAHRVIEKQRRDALNESFLDLARVIPALAPCRRLSKSLIVHESVEYLQTQREAWITAADEIQALLAENMQVVAELNTWRELHGLSPKQAQPASETLQKLLKVKEDVLGTFPGGFGDNAVEENKNGETTAASANSREPPPSQHQAFEAETMQVDLPPRGAVDMHEIVVAPVNVPEAVSHRPSLSHLTSYQSTTFGHDMREIDNAQLMNHQLMPSDLDLMMPYDDTFGISPILDGNLQPFPTFSLHQNSMYGNVGLASPGVGYFAPPTNDAMYYNTQQTPQHS